MKKLLLLLFVGLLGSTDLSAQKKPNFIFIMVDDAGYGDFGCYGQKLFTTPNIDRMAAKGMRFTQHYSGSTVCAPTRCSIMNGVHTGHAFVRGNREVQPEGQAPIPADMITIPKLLKDAGYTTGMFGKWGLGAPGSDGDPVKQGWDEFYGYNCQRQAHTFYPKHLWHNDKKVMLDGDTYSHDLIQNKRFSSSATTLRNPSWRIFQSPSHTPPWSVPRRMSPRFEKSFLNLRTRLVNTATAQKYVTQWLHLPA